MVCAGRDGAVAPPGLENWVERQAFRPEYVETDMAKNVAWTGERVLHWAPLVNGRGLQVPNGSLGRGGT